MKGKIQKWSEKSLSGLVGLAFEHQQPHLSTCYLISQGALTSDPNFHTGIKAVNPDIVASKEANTL